MKGYFHLYNFYGCRCSVNRLNVWPHGRLAFVKLLDDLDAEPYYLYTLSILPYLHNSRKIYIYIICMYILNFRVVHNAMFYPYCRKKTKILISLSYTYS